MGGGLNFLLMWIDLVNDVICMCECEWSAQNGFERFERSADGYIIGVYIWNVKDDVNGVRRCESSSYNRRGVVGGFGWVQLT